MPVPESLVVDENQTIPDHTMLFVKNNGTTPYTFKWAKAKYVVPPGMQAPVPYYAVTRMLGDPRTIDIPGDRRKAYRSMEFQRICVKLGVYDQYDQFDARRPSLEVYTLNNERVYMVADDPSGDRDGPVTLNAAEKIAADNAMKAMQAQMAQLQAQLLQLQNTQTGGVAAPADDPILPPEQSVVGGEGDEGAEDAEVDGEDDDDTATATSPIPSTPPPTPTKDSPTRVVSRKR